MRRRKCQTGLNRALRGVLAGLLPACGTLAWATDILYVQPAALDQPRINAYVTLTPGGAPQSFEGTFNIQAFYDTGASGILLSVNTAYYLGIDPSTYLNPDTNLQENVVYRDVGVAGSDDFNVSWPVHFALAPYHPDADVDNPDTCQSVYNQTFGPVRAQIGPVGREPDPLIGDLDVFGVPLMKGKVVVMDPKPVDTFLDTMRTYVYNPGTPFDPNNTATNPGIPVTNRHVRLSHADFSRFTETTPIGAPPPSMADNPFIGPNPVLALDPHAAPDSTPPVQLAYSGITIPGSFLLDTGSPASMISESLASRLGVTYVPGSVEAGDPVLAGVPLEDQFQITFGGIGGTAKKAGFFLDSLLLPTIEGDAANNDDPNHIRFVGAPVLVSDITVVDPATQQQLTLDGILGMNFLVASVFVSEGGAGGTPSFGDMIFGRFNWAVYDQPNALLGLDVKTDIPEQGSLTWFGGFLVPNTWDTVNTNFLGGMTLVAFQDGDQVTFTDLTIDPDVDVPEPVAPGSVLFDNSQVDYTLRGQPIQGRTGLTKRGNGRLTLLNRNTYTGTTDIQAGAIDFAAPQNIGPVNVHPGAQAILETTQHFEELNVVGGNALLSAGPGKLLVVNKLTITDDGTLDLTDNAAVIHADPLSRFDVLAQIGNLARSARGNDGAWAGTGLTSSTAKDDTSRLTALAVILNDKGADQGPFCTDFLGETVDVNSILVKYTWNGDANLDGVINADDYFRIDSGFLSQAKGYQNGDFNYDGVINADDYFLIDSAYLGQKGPLSAAVRAPAVPEPATLSLLAFASLTLIPRHRRA